MAAQNFLYLTVRRKSPSAGVDLPIPQRRLFPISILTNPPAANTKRGGSVVKLSDATFRASRKFEVYETIAQINTAAEPTSTNFLPDYNSAVAANAHTISSTTVLANYMNKVTTATGGSADALRLPAVANKATSVIVNASGVALLLFPNAAGEAIVDATGVQQSNGASITVPIGATIHVISDGTVNRVAVDA